MPKIIRHPMEMLCAVEDAEKYRYIGFKDTIGIYLLVKIKTDEYGFVSLHGPLDTWPSFRRSSKYSCIDQAMEAGKTLYAEESLCKLLRDFTPMNQSIEEALNNA